MVKKWTWGKGWFDIEHRELVIWANIAIRRGQCRNDSGRQVSTWVATLDKCSTRSLHLHLDSEGKSKTDGDKWDYARSSSGLFLLLWGLYDAGVKSGWEELEKGAGVSSLPGWLDCSSWSEGCVCVESEWRGWERENRGTKERIQESGASVCVSGGERTRLVVVEDTYCWLCWWQCNCLPFLRPGWQCWPHWPSVGPGRGGPLRGMRGTNCPWRHHHETEQHPLLSRDKEIPLDKDTSKGKSQRWRGDVGTMVSEDMWNHKIRLLKLWEHREHFVSDRSQTSASLTAAPLCEALSNSRLLEVISRKSPLHSWWRFCIIRWPLTRRNIQYIHTWIKVQCAHTHTPSNTAVTSAEILMVSTSFVDNNLFLSYQTLR